MQTVMPNLITNNDHLEPVWRFYSVFESPPVSAVHLWVLIPPIYTKNNSPFIPPSAAVNRAGLFMDIAGQIKTKKKTCENIHWKHWKNLSIHKSLVGFLTKSYSISYFKGNLVLTLHFLFLDLMIQCLLWPSSEDLESTVAKFASSHNLNLNIQVVMEFLCMMKTFATSLTD